MTAETEDMNKLLQEYANIMAEDSELPVEPNYPTEVEGVTIPDGFYYVGGTKEEGIVISDNVADAGKGTSHGVAQTLQGNQFVWIPVEDSLFQRYNGYYDVEYDERFTDGWSEPYTEGYFTEISEYEEMRVSVLENNGFYVGRYESGTTNSTRNENSGITDEVLIKQGQYVYNFVGWSNSDDMKNELGGAVELSKKFAEANGYTSVKSTLIYGVQWDAVMNFIDTNYSTGSCKEDSFVRDSTGKGWYEQNTPATTGSNANYEVKNVYDLGGNIAEWTMEAYNGTSRMDRGGGFNRPGSHHPASGRNNSNPSRCDIYVGFRVAMYIK